MTKTFTDLFVKKVKPPATGRREYWDALISGLGLRVSQSGRKTWHILTRLRRGKKIRVTLGRYPTISLEQARAFAKRDLLEIADGLDPRRKKKALEDGGVGTVSEAAEQFIEKWAKPRNRRWKDTKQILDARVIPELGDVPLREVTRQDLVALVEKIADEGKPYMANRTLAAIGKLFSWSLVRGMIDADPAAKIPPPGKESKRERVYTDAEVKRLWSSFEKVNGRGGLLLKLLLVTGQRRGEAAGMLKGEINLEEQLWTIPASKTKAGRIHDVPLSPLAVEILREALVDPIAKAAHDELLKISGVPEEEWATTVIPVDVDPVAIEKELVFPGRHKGRPIGGFSKLSEKVVKHTRENDGAGGIDDFRIHDLRRTAATGMAKLGVPRSTISRVLNHAEHGVTSIYDRHHYLPEKRQALEFWAKHLSTVVGITPVKPKKVEVAEEVPMDPRKKAKSS